MSNAVRSDPYEHFAAWFADAEASEPNDANAMSVATTTPDGRPSVRILLLKGFDQSGFTFFSNLHSRKGGELLANPHVSLCFHWKSLRRQVRVEGPVTQVSDADADAYFNSRPWGSRVGAWASLQSQPLDSRATLEARVKEFSEKYPESGPVPRPPHWSGFRLAPDAVEFWQDMPYRLHDRLVYTRAGGGWTTQRLFP
jgi:pyridoxamine 5'-phosphate oxidase